MRRSAVGGAAWTMGYGGTSGGGSAAGEPVSYTHLDVYKRQMKNKGPLYVLTCYVIWGLLPIFWKLLAQVDSLYVLASRIV